MATPHLSWLQNLKAQDLAEVQDIHLHNAGSTVGHGLIFLQGGPKNQLFVTGVK